LLNSKTLIQNKQSKKLKVEQAAYKALCLRKSKQHRFLYYLSLSGVITDKQNLSGEIWKFHLSSCGISAFVAIGADVVVD